MVRAQDVKRISRPSISEGVSLLRRNSRDNVGTANIASWPPVRPGRVDTFPRLRAKIFFFFFRANFYSLETKKNPPERVAQGDWLGHYKMSTGLVIFPSYGVRELAGMNQGNSWEELWRGSVPEMTVVQAQHLCPWHRAPHSTLCLLLNILLISNWLTIPILGHENPGHWGKGWWLLWLLQAGQGQCGGPGPSARSLSGCIYGDRQFPWNDKVACFSIFLVQTSWYPCFSIMWLHESFESVGRWS